MESDGFTLVKRARDKRKMLPQLIDPKLSKRDGFVSGECALSLEELEHQMTLFRGRFPHRHMYVFSRNLETFMFFIFIYIMLRV